MVHLLLQLKMSIIRLLLQLLDAIKDSKNLSAKMSSNASSSLLPWRRTLPPYNLNIKKRTSLISLWPDTPFLKDFRPSPMLVRIPLPISTFLNSLSRTLRDVLSTLKFCSPVSKLWVLISRQKISFNSSRMPMAQSKSTELSRKIVKLPLQLPSQNLLVKMSSSASNSLLVLRRTLPPYNLNIKKRTSLISSWPDTPFLKDFRPSPMLVRIPLPTSTFLNSLSRTLRDVLSTLKAYSPASQLLVLISRARTTFNFLMTLKPQLPNTRLSNLTAKLPQLQLS